MPALNGFMSIAAHPLSAIVFRAAIGAGSGPGRQERFYGEVDLCLRRGPPL